MGIERSWSWIWERDGFWFQQGIGTQTQEEVPKSAMDVLDRNRDLFLLARPPWGRQGLAALREPIGEANLGSFTRGPLLNPVLQRSGVVKHSSGSQSPRFPSIRKTTKTTSPLGGVRGTENRELGASRRDVQEISSQLLLTHSWLRNPDSHGCWGSTRESNPGPRTSRSGAQSTEPLGTGAKALA